MNKYTVTLTATSVKTFDIDAHSEEEAIALMNDIRNHTEMLNFTEMDVTELNGDSRQTITARQRASTIPASPNLGAPLFALWHARFARTPWTLQGRKP